MMKMKMIYPDMFSHVVLKKSDLTRIMPKLKNWTTLTSYYTKIDEKELEKLILIEINHKCRWSFLEKMMSRYSRLIRGKLEYQLKEIIPESPHEFISRLMRETERENTAA